MLPTGNCSHHGRVEGRGDGPSKTINREEFKLKGSEEGSTCQK